LPHWLGGFHVLQQLIALSAYWPLGLIALLAGWLNWRPVLIALLAYCSISPRQTLRQALRQTLRQALRQTLRQTLNCFTGWLA